MRLKNLLRTLLTLGALLVPSLAVAQTAIILPNAKTQFFDGNGDPLAGGTVEFYIPATSTPKTTWSDPFQANPNTNPVQLDASGEALIYGAGNYRQVVKDAFGTTVWDELTQGYQTPASGPAAGWGISVSGSTVSINTSQPPYPSGDYPVNIGLSATSVGTTLVVAITGANGSAPSATNPVLIPFRSGTATTGNPVWTAVTAATGFTVPTGAMVGPQSQNSRYWIFAVLSGGVPVFGIANCSEVTLSGIYAIYPCTGWENMGIDTTALTSASDSAGVLYTTNPVATGPVRIVGYVEGQRTGGGGFLVTRVGVASAGMYKPGDIVQNIYISSAAVATGTTVIPADDTVPTNTEGDQYLSVPYSPTSEYNFTKISAQAMLSHSAVNQQLTMTVFSDPFSGTSALATDAFYQATATGLATLNIETMQTVIPFGAQTVSMRAGGSGAGTTTLNGTGGVRRFGGTANSFLQVQEIMR